MNPPPQSQSSPSNPSGNESETLQHGLWSFRRFNANQQADVTVNVWDQLRNDGYRILKDMDDRWRDLYKAETNIKQGMQHLGHPAPPNSFDRSGSTTTAAADQSTSATTSVTASLLNRTEAFRTQKSGVRIAKLLCKQLEPAAWATGPSPMEWMLEGLDPGNLDPQIPTLMQDGDQIQQLLKEIGIDTVSGEFDAAPQAILSDQNVNQHPARDGGTAKIEASATGSAGVGGGAGRKAKTTKTPSARRGRKTKRKESASSRTKTTSANSLQDSLLNHRIQEDEHGSRTLAPTDTVYLRMQVKEVEALRDYLRSFIHHSQQIVSHTSAAVSMVTASRKTIASKNEEVRDFLVSVWTTLSQQTRAYPPFWDLGVLDASLYGMGHGPAPPPPAGPPVHPPSMVPPSSLFHDPESLQQKPSGQ